MAETLHSATQEIYFGKYSVSPTHTHKGDNAHRGLRYREIVPRESVTNSKPTIYTPHMPLSVMYQMCRIASTGSRYALVENSFYRPGAEELFVESDLGLPSNQYFQDRYELVTIADMVERLHQYEVRDQKLEAIISQISPFITFSLQAAYIGRPQLAVVRRFSTPQPEEVNYEAIFV